MQKSIINEGLCLLSCAILALCGCTTSQLNSPDPAVRRNALIKASQKGNSLQILREALNDDNDIVRRTAVRLISEKGLEAEEELTSVLNDRDPLIRRTAIKTLCLLKGEKISLDILETALRDDEKQVRLQAMSALVAVKPIDDQRKKIIQEHISKEKDKAIIRLGSNALWPFHRHTVLLKDRPDWDHEVRVISETPLPKDGWKFRIDPKAEGHFQKFKWYAIDCDETGWKPIEIEKIWETADFKYDGVAWYRRTIKAPEKPAKFNAVELHFNAVDECAWVWLNGIYIGEHNLGSVGWTIPFNLDITKEIKWGEENQITVRVLDTAGAGGIYKPVTLQILE
ncbi:MAG: HEAT repeat domain-containing protein [Victivallales bacterium]|nr:HEAT repeat domain-containing protein [Victivallales bacterium]